MFRRTVVFWLGLWGGMAGGASFDPDVTRTGMTMDDYMRSVPGGGQAGGPVYGYRLGAFEITNDQWCVFLNDAEQDANSEEPTRRSSHMHFDPTGNVYLEANPSPYEYICWVDSGHPDFDLTYEPSRPPGDRYQVKPGLSRHPARHLTWMGALKFCNWLTIDQGLPESHCCYAEGPHPGNWHPVTIDTQSWWGKEPAHNDRLSAGRDLSELERSLLVRRFRGYRLPMDDAGPLAGIDRPYPHDFNEWLKAAAYDPRAPDSVRSVPGGWQAVAHHWMYGFGREENTGADANWNHSQDPWEPGTVPVDFYDGREHEGFVTRDTNNPYGLYGISGNVWEWCQDYGVSMDKRSTRGGSWVSTAERQAASSCYFYGYVNVADISFGMRVLQVRGPRGDFDSDGDVDDADLARFVSCAAGPGLPIVDPACEVTRLDGDEDVDQEDFGLLQVCLAGVDELPPLECYH